MVENSIRLLHPEAHDSTWGVRHHIADTLFTRVKEVREATDIQPDPNVTVLIRTRNHERTIGSLIDDVLVQQFGGEKQLVVVDTESNDRTKEIAKRYGAVIVPLRQSTFNYADSLNRGFEAADHPFVVELVGHSNLSSTCALRTLTRWAGKPNFAAVYGAALPNTNATRGDILISALTRAHRRLGPAERIERWEPGALVAHRTILSKAVWKELGGYDTAYGDGGEDTAFARKMLNERPELFVVRDPGMSVLHSYGLDPLATVRQISTLARKRYQGKGRSFTEMKYRTDLERV
ncbi:glycosyltransferase family 2 protein [Candidatus Saccharibacteria bacterium]|nr:MAG: glycosyltransferase family 2 protein [Candidatus Saccharibacteria bacterium]